ncbi:hypothetical protein Anas_04554 [Armadillidium nasatum]|uniref:Uncharacterized protein n=1 Tax=Armadillidium nasatum TaxID=96803 RepID=A0A5N5SVW0_9CRUS|nr:hypothetical protein Anas_04554 [Armadillidium nasatum]
MRLQDIDVPHEEGLEIYCKMNFNEEQLKILKEVLLTLKVRYEFVGSYFTIRDMQWHYISH